MIPGLKHRRIGPTGHAFSADAVGYSVRAVLEEHGYKMRFKAEIKYAALNDRSIGKAHDLVYAALIEAIRTGGALRHENVPLFDVPDTAANPKGVNEL